MADSQKRPQCDLGSDSIQHRYRMSDEAEPIAIVFCRLLSEVRALDSPVEKRILKHYR